MTFPLVVGDFGVKFVGKHHAKHLEKKTLKIWYDITIDWTGKQYVSITLKWDYEKRTLDKSVPDCVKNKLHRFKHPTPSKTTARASKSSARKLRIKRTKFNIRR